MSHQWRIRKASDKPDWLDASQIDSVVDGVLFTSDMYKIVENRYIEVCRSFANEACATTFQVREIEEVAPGQVVNTLGWNGDGSIDLVWLRDLRDGNTLMLGESFELLRAILRGLIWCTLEAKRFYVEVGYDYYFYVGSDQDCHQSIALAQSLGLTVRELQKGQYRYRDVL